MIAWIRELRRRWPLIVGVLRGKTVVYSATIGPPEEAMLQWTNRNGVVIVDTFIDGGGVAPVAARPY